MKKTLLRIALSLCMIVASAATFVACGDSNGSEENSVAYTVAMPASGEGYSFELEGQYDKNPEGKYLIKQNNTIFFFAVKVKAGYVFDGDLSILANTRTITSTNVTSDNGLNNYQSNRSYSFSLNVSEDTTIALASTISLKQLSVKIETSSDYEIKKVVNNVAGDLVDSTNNEFTIPFGTSFMLDYKTTDGSKGLGVDGDITNNSKFLASKAGVGHILPDVEVLSIQDNDGEMYDFNGYTRLKFIAREDFSTATPTPVSREHTINFNSGIIANIYKYQRGSSSYILDYDITIQHGHYLYFGVVVSPEYRASISTVRASYKLANETSQRNAIEQTKITDPNNGNVTIIFKTSGTIVDDVEVYIEGVDLKNDYFALNIQDGFGADISLLDGLSDRNLIIELSGQMYIKKGYDYKVEMSLNESGYSLDAGYPYITVSGEGQTSVSTTGTTIKNPDAGFPEQYVYVIPISKNILRDFASDTINFAFSNIKKMNTEITLGDDDRANYTLYLFNNAEEYLNDETVELSVNELEYTNESHVQFKQPVGTTYYYLVKPQSGYYFQKTFVQGGRKIETLTDEYGFMKIIKEGTYANSIIIKFSTYNHASNEFVNITSNYADCLISDDVSTPAANETDLILSAPIPLPSHIIAQQYKIKVFGTDQTPSTTLILPAETYYNKEFYITLHNPALNPELSDYEERSLIKNAQSNVDVDMYISWKPTVAGPVYRTKLERGEGIYINTFKINNFYANMNLEADFISFSNNHRGSNDSYNFRDSFTPQGTNSSVNIFKNTSIFLGLNTYEESKMTKYNFDSTNGFEYNSTGPKDILYIKVMANPGFILSDFYLVTDNASESTGLILVENKRELGYVIYKISGLDTTVNSYNRTIYSASTNEGAFSLDNVVPAVTSTSPIVAIQVYYSDSSVSIEYAEHDNPISDLDDDNIYSSQYQTYIYGDTCRFRIVQDPVSIFDYSNAMVYVSTESNPLVMDANGYYSFVVKNDKIDENGARENVVISYRGVTVFEEPCKVDCSKLIDCTDELIVSFFNDAESIQMGGGITPICMGENKVYYVYPNVYLSLMIKRSAKYNFSSSKIKINGNLYDWPETIISGEFYQFNVSLSTFNSNLIEVEIVDYVAASFAVKTDDFADVNIEVWDESIGESGAYVAIVGNTFTFAGGDLRIRVSDVSLENNIYLYMENNSFGIQSTLFRRMINSSTGEELPSDDGLELIVNNVYSPVVIGTRLTNPDAIFNPIIH